MKNKTNLVSRKWMKNFLLLFVMFISVSSMMAQRQISGKVSENGQPLPGASVSLKGTDVGTITDENGAYTISIPGDGGTLVISYVGFADKEIEIGNQSTIDAELSEDGLLQEVVVTGYQEIRKRDITGAAAVVEVDDLKAIKGGSYLQNLAGRASGVTISTSGSPGDQSVVRVRGISAFGSNDPLYVIDGVQMQDSYQNLINPEDIESIQVLKDASMASIYGSRATNGVIVITTKKGKAGKAKVSYNSSIGQSTSVKGYNEIINTSSRVYAEAMKIKFSSNPSATPLYAVNPSALPKYVQPLANTVDLATYDILNNPITELDQVGTDWWAATTRAGLIQDHNISISGGNEYATFNFSGGYFGQEGILKHTEYNRGTIRMNSEFKAGKKFRAGENLTYAANWGVGAPGGNPTNGEQGFFGQILKSTPIVPLTDIKGNPGGHLSASMGNFTNPDQVLYNARNNTNKYNRVLGNVFAEFDIISGLTARTSFGIDLGNGFNRSFTFPEPYRVEGPKTNTRFDENWNTGFNYTWTNTLKYSKSFDKHTVGILAGQEAVAGKGRNIGGQLASYFTTDVNAWYLNLALGDPSSRNVYSGGGENRLQSYFGKVDYAFDDKYLLSGTIRRDGSSRFGPAFRYGVFPAVSAGWRLSKENFMKDVTFFSDLKLRASYGAMGKEQIRNYNFSDIYGGSLGSTFYDINGNNGATTGYARVTFGNANTKWESNITKNIGLDASFAGDAFSVNLDIYDRYSKDLLYNPSIPRTAGTAAAPFVNIGEMQNRGVDLGLSYRKRTSTDFAWNASLNLSRYVNEVKKISDDQEFFFSGGIASRIENAEQAFINKVGFPISSFNGYQVEGIIQNEADRARHVGSQIGGLKFKDVNGDGKITSAGDFTIIGNPHPDFTAGLNLGANYKAFDINAFLFASYGNDIFNYTKMFTYFTNFNSNVSKDFLEIHAKGNNPKLSEADAQSRATSSFYVEDGSYLRLSNLQVAYNLPKSVFGKAGLTSARFYIQGQNVLTLTGYSGVDPAVTNAGVAQTDLNTGFDGGVYPANKVINFGVNLQF
jgi:TonB-dependent starch-binding outer membrane protein SusC